MYVLRARLEGHGETKSKFTDALNTVTAFLPENYLNGVTPPNSKGVNDSYKQLMDDHRNDFSCNVTPFRIIEIRGEWEELLDVLMQDVDELE